MSKARSLADNWIHLGLGATAEVQPAFDELTWYETYAMRVAADGAEGRLVSQHSFTEDWKGWEMHPAGSEVVICTHGTLTLIQEQPDGTSEQITLTAGQYAINPPGVWHTANIADSATAIFITAGEGTQHRPR